MGSLYRRGRVWWLKYRQNGRAVRESSGTTKETVARRMLRLREGDVERGIPVLPKLGRVSFTEAAEDLLTDYRTNRKATLPDTERRLRLHLTPFFQNRRLASISTSDVRAFIAKRQADTVRVRNARRVRDGEGWREIPEVRRPVSAGEINRELSILKRMFSLAVQGARLHTKPYIPMLREDNVRRGFFEREQFEAVRTHLPVPLRPVVTFAYLTGWRLHSEVLPLQWRQVDWEAREIRLDPGTTKNREGRAFPFTGELQALLEAQRCEHESLRAAGRLVPFVFHRDGEPILDFRGAWRSACRAAGVPGRIFHDLRRTAVRNLERAGVPRSVAMAMVGHKTEAIYRRYAIVDAGLRREAASKLDAAAL